MSKYCVVVADGTRARFFSTGGSEPESALAKQLTPLSLTEHEDLASTEHEVRGQDMWTDRTHDIFDDHREHHEDEFERRFASRIASEAVQFAERQQASHLIVAAESRMLGFLRSAMHTPANASFKLHELNKDYVKLGPAELYEHLAKARLLPGRRPSGS